MGAGSPSDARWWWWGGGQEVGASGGREAAWILEKDSSYWVRAPADTGAPPISPGGETKMADCGPSLWTQRRGSGVDANGEEPAVVTVVPVWVCPLVLKASSSTSVSPRQR